MRNHNNKRVDMARSVLPSTARQRAKAYRRIIHHAERGAAHTMLHRAVTDGDDGFDDAVNYPYRSTIAGFVDRRRSADKIAPLVRWATRTVAADRRLRDGTPAEQLDHFRRIFPDDLIGRHALFHLRGTFDGRWNLLPRGNTPRRINHKLLDAVDTILAAGAVGDLNRALKRPCVPVVRVSRGSDEYFLCAPSSARLHGAHDRDRFADALEVDARRVVFELAERIRRGARGVP